MSAIPKDIAAKADAVYDALGRGSLADTGAIARAIFAERERCAQVVRSIAAFAFRDARDLLEIDDLRFHDLRHEGISRLFEMGLNIPHVATVSGHRSWQNLKRYTHIRQSGDKYEGWKWLDAVTQPLQP